MRGGWPPAAPTRKRRHHRALAVLLLVAHAQGGIGSLRLGRLLQRDGGAAVVPAVRDGTGCEPGQADRPNLLFRIIEQQVTGYQQLGGGD